MRVPDPEYIGKPLAKDEYKAVLCLMYGRHLDNWSDFRKTKEACRRASFYVATLDEIDVLYGCNKEEIFFEIEKNKTFDENRKYKLPRSLLDYPVQEAKLMYRLWDEIDEWKASLRSTQRKPKKETIKKETVRKKTVSPKPVPRSTPIHSYTGSSYNYRKPSDAPGPSHPVLGGLLIFFFGVFLMYGCAISLAAGS
ncbi:MAG: hypothetical protein ACR2N0_15180 [Rubrobacteraceae bacterium]